MATPFDTWDFQEAQKHLKAPKNLDEYKDFYDGDHWRDGEGYIGVWPSQSDYDSSTSGFVDAMANVEKTFSSENAFGAVIDRHVNGAIARKIQWQMVVDREEDSDEDPSAEEKSKIKEGMALLEQWEKQCDPQECITGVTTTNMYADWAPIRHFIPPGMRNESGEVAPSDLTKAIKLIHINTPSPPAAIIHKDPFTQQEVGIYRYTKSNKVDDEKDVSYIELVYLDEDQTILRILPEAGDPQEFVYNLGGRLTHERMKRKPIVDDSFVQQQKALNLNETMKNRNTVMAGFRSVTYLNAQRPQELNADKETFTITPMYVGAGTVNFVEGVEVLDAATGKVSMTNPSVHVMEPVSPETFISGKNDAYLSMLRMVNQLHYATAADGILSAESRIAARMEFMIELQKTKTEIDRVFSWAMETALAWAAALIGDPDYFDGFKIVANTIIDPGPITPDMLRAAADMHDRRLMSQRTAMIEIGIDEIDAEIEAIEDEQAELSLRPGAQVDAELARLGGRQNAGSVATNS